MDGTDTQNLRSDPLDNSLPGSKEEEPADPGIHDAQSSIDPCVPPGIGGQEQSKVTDSLPEQTGYKIQLEMFEGPLDLLLHLIQQEKIDIWDIPIARITAQYLEYLQRMEELNLNVAGDFVMMAANLIYIKSRMLLPPDPDKSVEQFLEEDPRRELVYQLLEHQKFKQAAQLLYSKETVESSTWGHPPMEVREGEDEIITATLFDLVKAFHRVLAKLEDQPSLEVGHEEYTIEQKIDEIRKLLVLHGAVRFSDFVDRKLTRHHLVVLFLAILELARQAEIYFTQHGLFGEIIINHARLRPTDIEPAEKGGIEEELPLE